MPEPLQHKKLPSGFYIIILLALIMIVSCDPDIVYERNTPVDPEGWLIADKKPFELEATDTLALLNFYINIRHTTDYKYRNIFLFLDTFFPEGTQSRDTIEIILADTKFEWGIFGEKIILIDEVLTPDSSRFWPADKYQAGRDQESFDKQFVRNYLESVNFNKSGPGIELPPDVIEKTSAKYIEGYEKLTGRKFNF